MRIPLAEYARFELIYQFVGIAERQLILGYNALSPSTKPSLFRKDLLTGHDWSDKFTPSYHLLRLLDLLLKIKAISSTPIDEHSPAPWISESLFMSLRENLDEYSLKQPEIIRFGSSQFAERVADNKNACDYILCSLAWHCCVIALNLRFLPLPTPQSALLDKESTLNAGFSKSRSVPKTFLSECVTACETSAASICIISTEAMANEKFLLVGLPLNADFSHTESSEFNF
jgi:hypothetical protein